MKILAQDFFDRSTPKIARELLGKFLIRRVVEVRPALRARKNKPNFHYPVRKINNKKIIGEIIDIEIYRGKNDKASHVSRGLTPRTKVMFGPAGYWYVYLIYGMHYCLNIVTERDGYPAAILIRGIRTEDGKEIRGPGRVCKYFKIDKSFNALPAKRKSGLWIEDRGGKINPRKILRGKRIGVDYAGEWKDKLWRFWIGISCVNFPAHKKLK